MKLKGVNPIEQHIEKIVLGIVLIVLLGVIAIQFVTTPNNITDGSKSIAPAQVFTSLEPQANQLRGQLNDLNPALPEVKPVDLVERYDNAFRSSGSDRLALSAPLGSPVDIATVTGTDIANVQTASNGPVDALAVPATSTPVAGSQWATLDPYAVQTVPEYSRYIPAQQPYDFPSISIEAQFSGTELRDVLTNQSSIPSRFWSATGIAILGFEVERQQLQADGSWGSAQPIERPPHTPTPTVAIAQDAGLQALTTLITNAAQNVDEVARPMFPPTIAGAEWVPPSERIPSADDSESSQIRRLQRQLQREQDKLERLTNSPTNPGGGLRTDPRGTGGAGKVGSRDDQRRTTQPTGRNTDQIQRVRDRIKELEDELKELGVEEDSTSRSRVRTSARDIRSVLEEEVVDLWAHDLGVEPGATYRYRTRVVVNNPLFRKGGQLDADDADQQALTRNPFTRGAWSEWSSPVEAGAREYYFVTGADLGGFNSSAEPKANIELYQMYYGHYRKSTLSVAPGDMLASDVRISGNLLTFDTANIPVEDAANAIEELQSEDGDSSELPNGVGTLPGRVSINMGVFVLDVYQGQDVTESALGGQQSNIIRVVLRDDHGEVVVRSEQSDEASQAYTLASDSASSAASSGLRAPGEPAIPASAELFKPVSP